jgi:hypothetical protein
MLLPPSSCEGLDLSAHLSSAGDVYYLMSDTCTANLVGLNTALYEILALVDAENEERKDVK